MIFLKLNESLLFWKKSHIFANAEEFVPLLI